ncbi:hypothetical protein L9F63_005504, partial [Diploptera punctata]
QLSIVLSHLTQLRDFDFNFFLAMFSSHFAHSDRLFQILQSKSKLVRTAPRIYSIIDQFVKFKIEFPNVSVLCESFFILLIYLCSNQYRDILLATTDNEKLRHTITSEKLLAYLLGVSQRYFLEVHVANEITLNHVLLFTLQHKKLRFDLKINLLIQAFYFRPLQLDCNLLYNIASGTTTGLEVFTARTNEQDSLGPGQAYPNGVRKFDCINAPQIEGSRTGIESGVRTVNQL